MSGDVVLGSVRSPRRGGFVTLLPEVPGVRCPWGLAAKTVADDQRSKAVAESAMVSFVRRGSLTPSCLTVAAATTLLPSSLDMVRVPSAHVGMPNYIGITLVPDGPGGRRGVWFESFNELHHLLDLVIEGRSISVVTQPLRLEWRFPKAGVREHTPDFLLTDPHGRVVLVDVTRASKLNDDPALLTVVLLTAATCAEVGWGYQVRTEMPAQRCRNLRFLAGFRSGEPQTPHRRAEMQHPTTMGELEKTFPDGRGRSQTLRMVANGEAFLDLDQPIGPRSIISNSPAPTLRPWLTLP